MNQGELGAAILKLGLQDRVVCIHASMRSFSEKMDADELLSCLLDHQITVVVPSFSYHFECSPPIDDQVPQNGMDYELASSETPGCFNPEGVDLSLHAMGQLPRAVLTHPQHSRGNHPLNSFSAVGPLANEIIQFQQPLQVYEPLTRLINYGGRILMMGTDLTSLTLIHYAEMLAGRQLFIRWAKNPTGNIIRTQTGSCSRAFNQLMPLLCDRFETMTVLGSHWQVAEAGPLAHQASLNIINDPHLTSCGQCLRCRDALLGGPILN